MSDHTAASYLACIDETVAALKESGETISDGLMVVCTLDGLPRDYSSFVDIANQRNPPYKYEELKIALLNHEDRLKGSLDTESVMFMKPRPSEINRSSRLLVPKLRITRNRVGLLTLVLDVMNQDTLHQDVPKLRKVKRHLVSLGLVTKNGVIFTIQGHTTQMNVKLRPQRSMIGLIL